MFIEGYKALLTNNRIIHNKYTICQPNCNEVTCHINSYSVLLSITVECHIKAYGVGTLLKCRCGPLHGHGLLYDILH